MRKYLLPNDGKFYKVNLHSHTNLSDGKQTPEEVKQAYMEQGYSAVAFTEHFVLFDMSYLCDDNFIALNAYEYDLADENNPPFVFYEGAPHNFSHKEAIHLNFFAKTQDIKKQVCFNPAFVKPYIKKAPEDVEYVGTNDFVKEYTVEGINRVIKAAKDNGYLVVFNHPSWSLNTYPLYSRLEGLDGLEIVNGASQRSSDRDYTPHVYDEMLRCGKRLICVGGDDNHESKHCFRGWTMVKAPALTYGDLMQSIERGDCYASSGPEIHELYVEDGNVHVKCSEAAGIYYSTVGRRKECRLAEDAGAPVTEATFTIDPEDIFFRISVKDASGEHANTRAYFLDELK